MNKVIVTYEYSDGKEGIQSFPSESEAMWWVCNEGDHLIDYTIHTSGKQARGMI
jgi:hypothetical protein